MIPVSEKKREIDEFEESIVEWRDLLFWDRELRKIGNALFEENDPEVCEALWRQYYLAQLYTGGYCIVTSR